MNEKSQQLGLGDARGNCPPELVEPTEGALALPLMVLRARCRGWGSKVIRNALALSCVIALCSAAGGRSVTISNTAPRADAATGKLLDAHDGSVMRVNGTYYWWAMGYGDCDQTKSRGCDGVYGIGDCGFRDDHTIGLYTSADLASWTTVSADVLPKGGGRPEGVYYRVKVLLDEASARYVMWVNMVPRAGAARGGGNNNTGRMEYTKAVYVVASSAAPAGPFRVEHDAAPGMGAGGAGDVSLLATLEQPQRAFVAYDAFNNLHKVGVEQLAPGFLSSMGASSGQVVSKDNNEAPMLFGPRKGWYYLLFGKCCCFCKEGSGSRVWAARDPRGPWIEQPGGNINREGGGESGDTIIQAQDSTVITVDFGAASGIEPVYIWTGDRWQSAPDQLKSHDLQYWQPLVFNDTASPPTIAPLSFVETFQLEVPR